MLQWIFNRDKLRYDYVAILPDGSRRVMASAVHPQSVTDDLPKDMPRETLSDADFRNVQLAAQGSAGGQAEAKNKILGLGQVMAKRFGVVTEPQAQPQLEDGEASVLPSNAWWQALNRTLEAGVDIKDAVFQLGQKEYELAQEMRNRGQDPRRWFDQLGGNISVQGIPGISTINDLNNPDILNNLTDTARGAARAALMERAHRLQQVANQWGAYREGAKRMEYVQGANLDIGDQERAYQHAVNILMRDPGKDRSLRSVQNPDGTVTSVYDELYPQYLALQKAKRDRDRQTAVWWPEQYVQQGQQARSQQVWNGLSQAQRSQMFGDEASYRASPTEDMRNALLPRDQYIAPGVTPRPAADGPVKFNVLPRLAMGGRVPRFEEGGEQIGSGLLATMSEQQKSGQIALDAMRQQEQMALDQIEVQREAARAQFQQAMVTLRERRGILVSKIQALTQPG